MKMSSDLLWAVAIANVEKKGSSSFIQISIFLTLGIIAFLALLLVKSFFFHV